MLDVAKFVNFETGDIPSSLPKHHSNHVAADFPRCLSNQIVLWLGRRGSVGYSEINSWTAATALPDGASAVELRQERNRRRCRMKHSHSAMARSSLELGGQGERFSLVPHSQSLTSKHETGTEGVHDWIVSPLAVHVRSGT